VSNTTVVQNAAVLLQHTAGIVKNYDNLYRKKGLKYNIFKIAGVSGKELIICRVIADLLNPKGRHFKGDLYLRLFWEIVAPTMECNITLDTARARVMTEYLTDEGRRIDIVIEDGKVFIPIEAKIWAKEQEGQIKDYAQFAHTKNGNLPVPVLYLTLDGHEPETAADANDYACISFQDDVLAWLQKCIVQKETENTPPVREIIKQLIEAVKSNLGYTEDEQMDKAISKLVTESEDTIRAALAINRTLDELDQETWELFKGAIFNNVHAVLPNTEVYEVHEEDNTWDAIRVFIKNSKYSLYINYDWRSAGIWSEGDKAKPDSLEEKRLAKRMSEIMGVKNLADETAVWDNEETDIYYSGLEDADEDLYPYQLYKQYSQHPDEVARRIVSIAQALEKA
jgi:hypothetical protein